MGAPKPPKITLKNVEGFIETVFGQGSKKLSKKGKPPNHTGRFEIDVAGNGEKIPFEFEDAVKLIRARQFAENREAAADAAEAAAEAKTAVVTSAAQVRNQDRTAAKRARAEAEAAVGSDQAEAKNRLAEKAEAKAELSQIKFQTLDDDAAQARALAIRRRTEAVEADDKLMAVAGETKAEERAKLIDQAIKEAEAKAVAIEYEERADKIIDNLEQYTAAYQKAMLDRTEATKNLTLAKSKLAEAKRDAKLSGANPVEAEVRIKAAEENVTKAQEAHQAIVVIYLRENGNKNNWRRLAREFLDDNADLDSKKLESMRRAVEDADNAIEAVATSRTQHQIPYTAARLRAMAAESDQAGLELSVARKAKDKADAAFKEAEKTGEGIDLAKIQAEEADANFQRASGVYESKRGHVRTWKERAAALLRTTDNDLEKEVLETAIQQAVPKASLSERMLEAAAQHDNAYRKLAQAQVNWRKAMQETNASGDPKLEKAAKELQDAKENLEKSHSVIIGLNQGVHTALEGPNLPSGDREVLESALEAVKTVEKEHELIHTLDKVAEYHTLREASLRAREEASQKLEMAKDRIELAETVGGELSEAQAELDAAQKVFDQANDEFVSNSAKFSRWQARYEKLLPPEQLAEIKVNEEAVQVVAKLEEAYLKRDELIARSDTARAVKKLADARVKELELANDQANLPLARAEAAAATATLEDIRHNTGQNYANLIKLEQRAGTLLNNSDQGLADSNQVRLQSVLAKLSTGGHNPTNVADCLNAATTLQDVRYDAVARAQKEVQETRAYLQMAKDEGSEDAIREAQIDFDKARQVLDEAEDEVFYSNTGVSKWELEANQLLQKSDLSASDRHVLQTALDEAHRSRANREPEFIRNNLAEKLAQRQETGEALAEARKLRDVARERLKLTPESETERENFNRAQAAYESAARVHNSKGQLYRVWLRKATALGVITAIVGNPDTAAASTAKPDSIVRETEADKQAREVSELRSFVEANSPGWQEAKQEYEIAKRVVFPQGTDNDEALGYINKASLEEMNALNRASDRLDKAEQEVTAQTQALIAARKVGRKEAEEQTALSDHHMLARHTDANLRKAQERYKETSQPVAVLRPLIEAQEQAEAELVVAKNELVEAEAEIQDIAGMARAAGSFNISPEQLESAQQVNGARVARAKKELVQAQANVGEAQAKVKAVVPTGVNVKEWLASKEVKQRVQEAKLVAATLVANKTEDLYIKERVRLKREDPEVGVANWAKEALAAREQREAKREDRLKKAAQGTIEPISEEEKELGLGYDPKTGVYTNFDEVPFANLVAKFEDKIDLADPRFLIEVIKSYEKLTWEQKLVVDEVLTPEVREFALVAYNVQEAHKERNDIELDQRASNDLHDSGVFIPYQKVPEKPATKPDPRIAEAPKQLGGSKSKQKTWDSLNAPTPAAQNFTPNVSESPDVNFSGSEYEEAMSVEQNIEQVSIPASIAKATVPKC